MEPQQQSQWQYKSTQPAPSAQNFHSAPSSTDRPSAPAKKVAADSFTWTTTEYFEHSRSTLWYFALLLATVVLAAIIYLITKDYFATGTIVALGMIAGYAASRKPKQIECQVNNAGIKIDQKNYSYSQFKSFGILRENQIPSMEFLPVKKLMPSISMHFDAKDEGAITSIVGQRLPYEARKMAGIDKLSHSLRF